MSPAYPQRHIAHTLENKSENYLKGKLPQDWLVDKMSDYGQDLQIGIVENGNVTGQELLIQLKASHERANTPEYETVKLKMSTYNYLKGRLGVVMLVKYVEVENEAYWILLRDITAPNPTLKYFTIRIPKVNRISSIDWINIITKIGTITKKKLRARLKNNG